MKSKLFTLFFALAASASTVQGDSFVPSTTRTVSSPNGSYLVRKLPSDKVKNPKALWPATILIVFHLNPTTQQYKEARRFEVKGHPDDLFIDDAGTWIVTLDECFGMGQGPNVVVVYDISGNMLHRWRLSDLYNETEIRKLRHSTSSIYWRGEASWGDGQKSIKISNPSSIQLTNGNSYSISYDNQFQSFVLDLVKMKMIGKVKVKGGGSE